MRPPTSMLTLAKIWGARVWLADYVLQRIVQPSDFKGILHLIIAVADHFEPAFLPTPPWGPAPPDVQEERLERWCREFPRAAGPFPDHDGFPFRHTYFYPAEQYNKGLIDRLAHHCQEGWGEIEIHLHHGLHGPDSSENTGRVLSHFRDLLVGHRCLSRWNGMGPPRYAFVHGNWALANSAGGDFCGVDDEMQILADTGCYADLTLPSAPSAAQVGKINSLYECAVPLNRRAPHRRGRDLIVGRPPHTFPIIVQGPLMLDFGRLRGESLFPGIENSEMSIENPPTQKRLRLWKRAMITVRGRPDWLFIKLHCHGMDPRDESVMFGPALRHFLQDLTEGAANGHRYRLHFVTAREMVNIILAACDGADGMPGQYRDYRLKLNSRQTIS